MGQSDSENKIYITDIYIKQVRHLKDIDIPSGDNIMKHFIITGKNGSGKTSLLNAISNRLNAVTTTDDYLNAYENADFCSKKLEKAKAAHDEVEILKYQNQCDVWNNVIKETENGLDLKYNVDEKILRPRFIKGEFIVAGYKANRAFKADTPAHIERVELKDNYTINDEPRKEFVKYLVDKKVTAALLKAKESNDPIDKKKADEIDKWFDSFEKLLGDIFEDKNIRLRFDDEKFVFSIQESGRKPFGFNEMSDGFAAVLDIIADIMIRMEKHTDSSFSFTMPGIVIIDEIETHLHVELQKRVMHILTTLFPNIQFIVSTHSPFIINSIDNVVIFDLENHTLVNTKDGLTNVPYDGIVEGYLYAGTLSDELTNKYKRYKELIAIKHPSDSEISEIAELEYYLNEIPDYLNVEFATEYKYLKNQYHHGEE